MTDHSKKCSGAEIWDRFSPRSPAAGGRRSGEAARRVPTFSVMRSKAAVEEVVPTFASRSFTFRPSSEDFCVI